MEPDLEKGMKERMEQAFLKDVMPGFDTEREWQRLDSSLRPRSRRITLRVWPYAATVVALVVVAGLALLLYRQVNTQEKLQVAAHGNTSSEAVASNPDTSRNNGPRSTEQPVAQAAKKDDNGKSHLERSTHQKYMISNSTDCPMEISICQTMKCPNSQPAAISTSSTLEPGQSAPLGYKETESVPKNCSLTVEEIQIKSISTGEAITLDAHSSPSTAGEIFSYLSGEKRGDVLAGVFNLDCNKHTKKHSLRLDNRAGSVIMQ
jgi:hypothetical protein